MSVPILRLVCGACLRSVEITADGFERAPQMCPYCGGAFESQPDEMVDAPSSICQPLTLELSSNERSSQSETVDHKGLGGVGRFQIRETLGGGGFGHVHRAYDPRLDRDVALKVLKETQPGARVMERFFREARAAARLDHPNIVTLHDAGRDSGQCWIAYQYVAGRTLSRFQEQTTIDFETAARLVRGLAGALVHAHERGVFHRDLKPSNVIIDNQGRPRLTDFGLAKRLDFDSTLTREGTVLGTPAYMSPEQAEGRSHLADARSDIYSLGVVFYEMLAGRRPTDLPSSAPLWRATQMPPAPPPRAVNPNIPAALDRICQRALAHNPADRYPDAQSMLDDLDRWLEHQRTRKRRLYVRTGLAALLVLSALGLYSAGFSTKGAEPSSLRIASHVPDEKTQSGPIETPAVPVPTRAVAGIQPASIVLGPFLGNRSSKVYHRAACPTAASMLSKHRVEFASSAEAQAQGYAACRSCQPDRDPSGGAQRARPADSP